MQKKIFSNMLIFSVIAVLFTTIAVYFIQTALAYDNAKSTMSMRLINIIERMNYETESDQMDRMLKNITIGSTGYVFSVFLETGLISSHPNQQLIGTFPPKELNKTGFMVIDHQKVMYYTDINGGQLLTAVLPTSELYNQRTAYSIIFASFIIIVFGAYFTMLNLYLKRNIIRGISDIILSLDEISMGNLDVMVQVSSCEEFKKLSDGINQMMDSIKLKIDEIAVLSEVKERFGVIISSSVAGVIIKDKNLVVTDWNAGAERILGYTREEAVGRTMEFNAYIPKCEDTIELSTGCLNGESIAHAEALVIHKNRSTVICSTSISPIFNTNNEVDGIVLVFHDVTTEKAIDKKAKKLAAIIAIADAGIIVKDCSGIVQEWNIGAENILGYKPEDIIGKSTKYYAPEEAHSSIDEIDQRLNNREHIAHLEVVRKHKNGKLIDCSASYTPIFDNDGNCSGSVSIFHDISDKKQAERSLKEAVIAAKEASNAKSSFLANMSHEIRTPMNGILGFTELALDNNNISDESRNYLHKIKTSAVGMLEIINNILDISKIESGRVELEKIPFWLSDTLKHCESIGSVKANEKGVILYFYTEPYVPGRIIGDPTRLRQILLNLLSNAIKFTNKGTVMLITLAEQVNEGKITLHFEVKDSGIGMAPEQIERIFDPFTQADTSTTRKYGGTGLGLSIAKNLIELMGGILKVDSMLGVGSRFSFSLTFDLLETVEQIEDKIEKKIDDIKKPFFHCDVLVCEDNITNQQVINEHLVKVGINPVIVNNGKLGINEVKSRMKSGKNFDLILMDIHMPVMDGLETSIKLKNMGIQSPIIALTANIMTEEKQKYSQHGIIDYIAKPFTKQELWKCLLKYLTPANSMPSADVDTPATTSAEEAYIITSEFDNIDDSFNLEPSEDSVIDPMIGVERAAGNEQLYTNILLSFIEDNKNIFKTFLSTIYTGNIKSAHRLMHSLKSSSATIGAKKLSKTAADIEDMLVNKYLSFTEMQLLNLEQDINLVLKNASKICSNKIERRSPSTSLIYEPQKVVDEYTILNIHNKKKASELTDKLIPILESGSTKCIDLIPEIKETMSFTSDLTDILVLHIENYEFEQAIEILKMIKDGYLY